MAITDYTTLVAAAQSFMLDRADLQTPMPELVMAAEHMIYHGIDDLPPLRVRLMETVATLVTASGIATVPSDYLQWKAVTELSNPRRELDFISRSAAEQQYGSRSSGLANGFNIVGSSLYTYPLTSNSVELIYYASPTPIDSSNPSVGNAMLVAYPLLYLRAVQAAAAEWLKDYEEMKVQLQLLRGVVTALNREVMLDTLARGGIQFRRQVR